MADNPLAYVSLEDTHNHGQITICCDYAVCWLWFILQLQAASGWVARQLQGLAHVY